MSFRWYGLEDNIPLEYIAQIPGMEGIVSAIYDIPVGEVWPERKIKNLQEKIESHGLTFTTIESLPVHEDIKLGRGTRDKYIANYRKSLENLAKAGVKVVAYNFMPLFDWLRTEIDYQLFDGSTTLRYNNEIIRGMDPVKEKFDLPGWDTSFDDKQLQRLLSEYRAMTEEDLWSNLEYFLQQIIDLTEKYDIKMAIHPDDPPWSIFGLPRIITNMDNLKRLVNIVDSPCNGLTLCTGSLASDPENDLLEIIKYFGRKNKIHFAHVRNVKSKSRNSFIETAHLTQYGDIDMYQIIKALYDTGFNGPLRPDHGRMIWGETGKPGYGLYDRALASVYLHGLWEAIEKNNR